MSRIHYREATSRDALELARCRLSDPAAGPADQRMAAYLEGRHHPGELLRFLARWFTRQGAARICVNVEPSNAVARAFYARHGATELSGAVVRLE